MKIIYTKHAIKKFKDLKELGITVSKTQIRKIITDPLHRDSLTEYPKIIDSGKFDRNHVLRVVYRAEDAIIIVITFYPTRIGRYFI